MIKPDLEESILDVATSIACYLPNNVHYQKNEIKMKIKMKIKLLCLHKRSSPNVWHKVLVWVRVYHKNLRNRS